ncbi:MAG: GNAT family N-acetyltransferase [Acidimicrobiales bacterium]
MVEAQGFSGDVAREGGASAKGVFVRRLDEDEARTLLGELTALVVRSKASWGYDEEFMARFVATSVTHDLVDERRVCLVAFETDRPVGVAVVDDEGARAWLEDLWVEPEHFARGVGRALWDAALRVAREWDRAGLELESDPNAEGFYLAMGARRTGTRASSVLSGRELPLMRCEVPAL